MGREAVLELIPKVDFVSEYEQERGKPMPSLNHGTIQLRLGSELLRRYEDEYSVISEVTLDTSPPMTPDLVVYPEIALNWIHDQIRMTDPPLLVVEIISPSQSVDEMIPKIERYFDFGVRSCWLVQPPLQQIAVFTPEMQPVVFTHGPIQDPASGFSVNIEDIFKG